MSASDASVSTAAVLPFVHAGDADSWKVDRKLAPPVLVPMLSFGRLVHCHEHLHQQGHTTYTFTHPPPPHAGGPKLRAMCIDPSMFSADAMLAASTDLADMKVAELKAELQTRGKPCSGVKPLLLRRLHAAIMCAAVAERDENEMDYWSDSSE